MDHTPRPFIGDAPIREIGQGLLARTLPKERWTHEAHLAATLWLIVERPDIAAERDLPDIIRGYNVSVGGVNSDTEGYHETITQTYIRAVRGYLSRVPAEASLSEKVNALLQADEGRRDWPLRLYSRERLFSVAARRTFVEPDLV